MRTPNAAVVSESLRSALEKRFGMSLEDLLTEVALSEVVNA